MFLCAVSASTFFAISYNGSLDRMLSNIKLAEACAIYSRRKAVLYAFVAWAVIVLNFVFMSYSMFFTGGYIDIMLAPLTIHVTVSDLLVPRVIFLLFGAVYLMSAFVFPQTMTFMLATIFSHQYKELDKSFVEVLAKCEESRVSDSDIETLAQH